MRIFAIRVLKKVFGLTDIWKARESCRTGRFVSSTHCQILLSDQINKYLMYGHVKYVEKIDSLEGQGAGEK